MEVEKSKKGGLTKTQLILMLLASEPSNCLSLSELREKTKISENELSVYLSRLKSRGLITSKSKKGKEKRERIYCLKVKDVLSE